MKICSWNMLFMNRDLDRALEFIAQSDFDIFCLQEVPEAFLAQLETLSSRPRQNMRPFSIAYTIDVERLDPDFVPIFLVTLSRHTIVREGRIPFPDYWPSLPWRTRLFVRLMRPFHFTKIRNRSGLYTDLSVAGQSVRVFNLHLILAHPSWRLKEFETAMAERDASRPTIVCGDFNILEKPHIALLNWALGGRASDALRYGRERTRIEKRFVEHALVNALRGAVTHPISRSQLDHILVSRSFSIKNAFVLPDRLGSDHHPICVEVA